MDARNGTEHGIGRPRPGMTRREAIAGLGCMVAARVLGPAGAAWADAGAAGGEVRVVLSDDGVTVDGRPAGSDPDAAVYVAHDVVYYEDRDTYDSGNPYGEGGADERHSAQQAAAVSVVHVCQPGTYRMTGSISAGQIWVDLGKDAYDDNRARVVLVLDGLDIACDVAPAIVFANVYECDGAWSLDAAGPVVDTSDAGAVIVVADGSVNNVAGSHVARIYKDNDQQKKLWKMDGAVYSFMSMNVEGGELGDGVLNIVADNEGLDSELHLTFNGGNVSILSQDDGINTNEDGVSVTTVNAGTLRIVAGLGEEGDGIDSNGFLVINGGAVISMANPRSDSGLDSDQGSYVNGGTVVALGSTMDWAESDSDQVTMNLQFASSKDAGDAIVVCDPSGTVVFAYDPSEDETAQGNTRSYTGAILSCADFAVGQTYSVYVGGTVIGDEVQGVYDVATVTAYEGGVQQAFTGTDVQRGPGAGAEGRGGFGGDAGFGGPAGPAGEPPEMPAGSEGPGGTEGDRQPPEMPEGFGGPGAGTQPPEMPEGPAGPGTDRGPRGPESPQMQEALPSTDFYLQDKVNAFSGVADVGA